MPFPWTKKVASVVPVVQPEPRPEPQPEPQPEQKLLVEPEVTQTVELPVVDDKISVIEHKNGEQMVDARQEDDETNEVEGDLCQGQGVGTSDQGSEEDLEEARRG
jgi:hypothetical protein